MTGQPTAAEAVESALRSAGLCELVTTDRHDLTPPVWMVRARPAEVAQALADAGLLAGGLPAPGIEGDGHEPV